MKSSMKLFLLVIGMVLSGIALSQGVSRGVVYALAAVWFIAVVICPSKKKPKGTTWGSENRSELSKMIDER